MTHSVFISYSWHDKAAADAICAALEGADIGCWIAPRDVLPGMSYSAALVDAIHTSRILVLVFSSRSNTSPQVMREVERAVSQDISIIPVRIEDVLPSNSMEYFISATHWLDAITPPFEHHLENLIGVVRRLHDSTCQDAVHAFQLSAPSAGPVPLLSEPPQFNPAAIEHLRVPGGHRIHQVVKETTHDENLDLIELVSITDRQSRLLKQFGAEVLDYICRRPEPSVPMPVDELYHALISNGSTVFRSMTPQQMVRLLADARNRGFTPGLGKSPRGYFVAEANIAFKVIQDRELKEEIGRFAARLVRSGMRVAMDGGSTTLPIGDALIQALDEERLYDLTIVTNSLPMAQHFAEFMERRGWSDDDCTVQVIVTAGWLRPTTQAMAELQHGVSVCRDSLEAIVSRIGGLDCCFVGGNGITAAYGITMGSDRELWIKRLMLESAADPYVVADVNKFGIQLPVKIAGWDERLTLLTNRPAGASAEFEAVLNAAKLAKILTTDSSPL